MQRMDAQSVSTEAKWSLRPRLTFLMKTAMLDSYGAIKKVIQEQYPHHGRFRVGCYYLGGPESGQ